MPIKLTGDQIFQVMIGILKIRLEAVEENNGLKFSKILSLEEAFS